MSPGFKHPGKVLGRPGGPGDRGAEVETCLCGGVGVVSPLLLSESLLEKLGGVGARGEAGAGQQAWTPSCLCPGLRQGLVYRRAVQGAVCPVAPLMSCF